MSDIAKRDQNSVPTLLAVSNVDGTSTVTVYADPVTHRLLVDLASGSNFIETPSGTVDGNNVTFTVTNTPLQVQVDGLTHIEGFGYSYLAGTITLDVAPQQWIRSIH